MRIRDPGWRQFGSGMEKSRIRDRDKHPGSATLEKTQLEDVKSLVVCVVGTLHVYILTVEKTLVLTYVNIIAGQCRTNP